MILAALSSRPPWISTRLNMLLLGLLCFHLTIFACLHLSSFCRPWYQQSMPLFLMMPLFILWPLCTKAPTWFLNSRHNSCASSWVTEISDFWGFYFSSSSTCLQSSCSTYTRSCSPPSWAMWSALCRCFCSCVSKEGRPVPASTTYSCSAQPTPGCSGQKDLLRPFYAVPSGGPLWKTDVCNSVPSFRITLELSWSWEPLSFHHLLVHSSHNFQSIPPIIFLSTSPIIF